MGTVLQAKTVIKDQGIKASHVRVRNLERDFAVLIGSFQQQLTFNLLLKSCFRRDTFGMNVHDASAVLQVSHLHLHPQLHLHLHLHLHPHLRLHQNETMEKLAEQARHLEISGVSPSRLVATTSRRRTFLTVEIDIDVGGDLKVSVSETERISSANATEILRKCLSIPILMHYVLSR